MTGPEVKAARVARGLTQAQLAAEAGVGERTIRNMEAGCDMSHTVVEAVRSVLRPEARVRSLRSRVTELEARVAALEAGEHLPPSLEPLPDAAAKAAHQLITFYYLYSGEWKSLTRSAAGCIYKALEELDPQLAKLVADDRARDGYQASAVRLGIAEE